MLLNVGSDLGDFHVELLDLLFLFLPLGNSLLLLQLLVFLLFVVVRNKGIESIMVSIEFLLRFDQSILPVVLFSSQGRNFILNVLVSEFCVEHFFLLVNELLHVQVPRFFWELNTGSRYVQGSSDRLLLLFVVAVCGCSLVFAFLAFRVFDVVCWLDVRVLHSSEWCS